MLDSAIFICVCVLCNKNIKLGLALRVRDENFNPIKDIDFRLPASGTGSNFRVIGDSVIRRLLFGS
jgi:hypothetical protein